MKGSYVLIIKLDTDKKLIIGKLGEINFKSGYYSYIGSALKNLEKRINRHLKKEKNKFWHIDHFLEFANVIDVFYTNDKLECEIPKKFAKKLESIRNFGSSDCKCNSHLFYGKKQDIYNLGKKLITINWENWILLNFKK